MAEIKWRTLRKYFSQTLQWLWFRLIWPSFRCLAVFLNHLWERISKDKQYAFNFFLTLVVILGSLSLVMLNTLPTSHNFEGKLLVSSLSFTNNESDRLLLKDVRNLEEISISGRQKFTLAGRINSTSHPQLNKLDRLDIELLDTYSYLRIVPTTNLSLQELRLQPQTRIKNLKYASYSHNIAFTLEPGSSSPPFLLFNPGSSLSITLFGYRLGNSSLASNDTPLEFTLDTTQFQLTPTQAIDVNLQLPPQNNPGDLFWRNIKVTKVKFERLVQSGKNVGDDIFDSTIISGEIRMAKQALKLEENQFLIITEPGVQTLNQIEIVQPDPSQNLELKTSGDNLKLSEAPQGLDVSISGTTTSIQAGLNPKLAIAQIQGSFLSPYVSQDVTIAIISFSAGLIVSLLSWLFNNFGD